MNSPIVFIFLAISAGLIFLNIRASILVTRFPDTERGQRLAQYIFVWCLPFLGSLLVFSLLRGNANQRPSSKVDPPPEEDFIGADYRGPSITIFRED
jgi:hypothetical protein